MTRITSGRSRGEEETAAALGGTDRTVRRGWIKAKGFLHQALLAGAE